MLRKRSDSLFEDASVTSGASKRLSVELTSGANARSSNRFRLIHLAAANGQPMN
ncbi:MAG: hypothetical protein ACK55Z_09650 [bacterium]